MSLTLLICTRTEIRAFDFAGIVKVARFVTWDMEFGIGLNPRM